MKKFLTLIALAIASVALAQATTTTVGTAGMDINRGLMAIGMGLALGLGAIGTGLAQGRIGAAAAGVIAEDGSKFGTMLILLVISETLVIFGFLLAFLIPGLVG